MRAKFLLFALFIISFTKGQFVIRNTTVVDVENQKSLPGMTVIIKNGIISAIGKDLRSDGEVIDGSGKFLIPGLVDAHVHFFQSGSIYTRPDAVDLRRFRPHEEELKWAHDNMENFMRRYLSAGITTVVDVGSSIRFLQQRDSFRTKPYAPSVYMTGPLLTTWEPGVFKNMGPEGPFFEMKTEEDAREYVKQQLPYKPDFIKIWYIVQGSNVDSSARKSLPLVKAVIEEAHGRGLRVAVHATERITALLSVEAGADYLVHSVDDELLDDAFIKLLKERKTVLSPTLVVFGNYYKAFGQTYTISNEDKKYAHPTPVSSMGDLKILDTAMAARYRSFVSGNTTVRKQDSIMSVNLKKLSDAGVIIATGTDAGNIGTQHVSSYYDELRRMQQSGMDMWQLLRASTINGAKAVGKEAEFGSIAQGKRADLVLLARNPLENISNWQSIEWVFNRGNALKPDSLVLNTPEELANQQLLAYNAHDLEAFLKPYADDVEVYTFPDKLTIKGKDQMRKSYEFLNRTPTLHCRLLKRIVQGNIVIDHEEVWGFGDKPFYGVAIYEIKDGKIRKVYFPE